MENKKLGIILLILSLVILYTFFQYGSSLQNRSEDIGCYPSQDCIGIEKNLAFSHILIGVASFVLALAFYLIFFNKTEKAILDKLENEKMQKIEDIKFDILMKALDPFEQKVIRLVREQEGITQNTLRLRADMSKAKLSYVLQELERRGIIKRIEKGQTLAIYFKI